jgi:hypothetical protein
MSDLPGKLTQMSMESQFDDYDGVLMDAAHEIRRLTQSVWTAESDMREATLNAECWKALNCQAADEIERLRAEVEQLESAWTFINIWRGRYESERALADQLAEALREVSEVTKVLHGRGDLADCLIQSFTTLATYETAHKEADRG